jgi:hypothetical protein
MSYRLENEAQRQCKNFNQEPVSSPYLHAAMPPVGLGWVQSVHARLY